jgi:hypothetical protein
MSGDLLQAKIAHLNMIQTVTTRMAGNSATCKNLCMTIVAALLALYANKQVMEYLYICFVPTVLFFFLDAKYLRLERGYRALYNSVRKENEQKTDFDLSPSFEAAETTISVALTWSILWFYGTIATLPMIIIFYKSCFA